MRLLRSFGRIFKSICMEIAIHLNKIWKAHVCFLPLANATFADKNTSQQSKLLSLKFQGENRQ